MAEEGWAQQPDQPGQSDPAFEIGQPPPEQQLEMFVRGIAAEETVKAIKMLAEDGWFGAEGKARATGQPVPVTPAPAPAPQPHSQPPDPFDGWVQAAPAPQPQPASGPAGNAQVKGNGQDGNGHGPYQGQAMPAGQPEPMPQQRGPSPVLAGILSLLSNPESLAGAVQAGAQAFAMVKQTLQPKVNDIDILNAIKERNPQLLTLYSPPPWDQSFQQAMLKTFVMGLKTRVDAETVKKALVDTAADEGLSLTPTSAVPSSTPAAPSVSGTGPTPSTIPPTSANPGTPTPSQPVGVGPMGSRAASPREIRELLR